ncbi:MAG: choice-of-anchor R domain-containing protein, partial [Halioglobus sp.]
MSITSSLRSLAAILFLCSCLLIPSLAHALETQVLSNFNQPSSGVAIGIGVRDVEAIPFITDASFTEFDGVELTVRTLSGPGLFFVEIWDVALRQPNNVIAVLTGPSAPSGFTRYTGAATLQPNTSYFLVYGIRNGGSQVRVDAIDLNGADATPAPIYQFGTDTDNDGNPNVVNRCRGDRANDYVTISWSCTALIATRYFSKLRFLAEEPAPPVNYSLTASPLSVDFGLVPSGTTSTPVPVIITNDGTVDQLLGTLDVGPRFTLSNDNCSGQPLAQNGTCMFEVSFTPDHGGFTTGTVV